MKRKLTIFVFALTLLVAFSACNMPSKVVPTATLNPGTQVALTLTANAEINPPTATYTPEMAATATNTPEPTWTFTPQPTTTNTPLPPTSTSIPCNLAQFVKDVTIPDNTQFDPGEAFTKTWRLKNIGSCQWNSGYDIVFSSGDSMGGPAAVQLTTGSVPTGGTVDVSVNLVAPDDPDTYRGNWKLRDDNDQIFGISSTSSGEFWVQIKVVDEDDLNFSASFHDVDYCGLEPSTPWFIEIKITNTGDLPILSYETSMTDTNTSQTKYNSSDKFTDWNGCAGVSSQNDLTSGESGIVSSGLFSNDPTGHTINATIKVCTKDGSGGTCVSKTITFTP